MSVFWLLFGSNYFKHYEYVLVLVAGPGNIHQGSLELSLDVKRSKGGF